MNGRREWFAEGDALHFNDMGAGAIANLIAQCILNDPGDPPPRQGETRRRTRRKRRGGRTLAHAVQQLCFPVSLPSGDVCHVLDPAQRVRAIRVVTINPGTVFYGYWDPRFTLLMAFSTLVSYTAGLGIPAMEGRAPETVVPHHSDYRRFGAPHVLQVRGLSPRLDHGCGARDWIGPRAADPADRAAGRHLLLHVPHDYVHRQQLWGTIAPTRNLFEFSRVRLALFPAGRWSNRSVQANSSRIWRRSARPHGRDGSRAACRSS